MHFKSIEVSWVDWLVVILLLAGVARGRQRGMSQELLDVFKWLLVVAVAGMFYQPVGEYLSAYLVFGLLSCYLMAYLLLMLAVLGVFAGFRHAVGQKLVSRDLFGRGEYYLGMGGGLLRHACVVVVALSLLNARYYSPEDIRAQVQYQQETFGSVAFPTLASLQEEVFKRAWTGRLAAQYLSEVLIRPTSPHERPPPWENNLVKARARELERVLENR